MRTINIRTDAATNTVPVLVPFQGAPHDIFTDGEEILVQLVNDDGEKVGEPEIRSVIKTQEENQSAWYDAYIPLDRNRTI